MHTILVGDVREQLKTLPDNSIQCCVTSPPYWGLRDYGHDGQIGLESTPEAYVAHMVEVFREVRRVLRDDGTCWINLGDSYNNRCSARKSSHQTGLGFESEDLSKSWVDLKAEGRTRMSLRDGAYLLKEKDIVGIPWRVAFALQADGWWLRQDIIWSKPNPMPESVTDRCTKAHEYVFLLTKSARYYYDAEAMREPCSEDMQRRAAKGHTRGAGGKIDASRQDANTLRGEHAKVIDVNRGRNRRSVWTITTKPYHGAHFAVMPEALVEPCLLAGSKPNDTVLDPFLGSGTTLAVAKRLGRNGIGIELNPEYVTLAENRIGDATTPLF